jgi:hypothetical protein
MNALTSYGVGALVLILIVFYWVRTIPAYIGTCVVIVVGYAGATYSLMDWKQPAEWMVMVAGQLLCSFGLLIVRIMLTRSVSLQLLRRIEDEKQDAFGEDIAGRLNDMRSFRLIRATEEGDELTHFGRSISTIVAVLYSVFKVRA